MRRAVVVILGALVSATAAALLEPVSRDAPLPVAVLFRDPRFPVFFIEAQRHFGGIPADTGYDALSYRGWFRRDRAGALIPIGAPTHRSGSHPFEPDCRFDSGTLERAFGRAESLTGV